ncbi:MAG: lasso peptide biosynthesis B2 protein [Erythrobacter sp.]
MPKLQTFLALDSADRIATVEAIGRIAWAQWLVKAVPPRLWRSQFGGTARDDRKASGLDADIATIRRVRLAVARAHRNLPGDAACLPQALAARRMLERRGISSTLYIGTMRDEGGHRRFHAWLKVGEEWVTGVCDERRYALMVHAPPKLA